MRLNMRLKWVNDWKPTAKAISLMRKLGFRRRVLAFSTRVRETNSVKLRPVALRNCLQK